jgi:two-component sensor histidine kinase
MAGARRAAGEGARKTGFGTRLVERGLASELGGTVRLAYEPGGLVCTIEAPLPRVGADEEGLP